jgi:hypothetical protein
MKTAHDAQGKPSSWISQFAPRGAVVKRIRRRSPRSKANLFSIL